MSPSTPPRPLAVPPLDPAALATRDRTRRRASWRTLAVLTLVVGGVHLLLLDAVPMTGGATPSPVAARLVVRTIAAAPEAPPAAEPRPAIAPAPREAARTAPTRPAKPAPAPRPRASPAPALPAAPVVPIVPVPPPVTAATSVPDPDPTAPAPPLLPTPVPGPDRPVAVAPADPAPPSMATDAPSGTSTDASTATADAPAGPAPAEPASAPSAGPPAATGAPPPAAPAATSGPGPENAPLNVPASVRLKFDVTGQQGPVPLQGVFGELVWSQDGRAYDANLTLRFLFKTLRTQHSSGVIGSTGIEPARFSDTRKTEVASHFVRDRGEVVFSNNAPSVALLPGAQDRLSVMLQLGALLAGDPARYPLDGAIAVQTVGPRDADIWLFKVGPEETLALPMGEIVGRRLTRNARAPFDDTVELWLAPSLGYLPVRIKLTQPNGDFADMQLREPLPGAPGR